MLFANGSLEKILIKLKNSIFFKIIFFLVLVCGLIIKRLLSTYVFDSYIAALEIILILDIFRYIRTTQNPGINLAIKYITRGLSYLGKHSLVIWLTHSLLILYWPQFVYWLKWPILIYPWYLSISLLLDYVVEKIYEKISRIAYTICRIKE